MLEYWAARNETRHDHNSTSIEDILQDPGSVVLFVGYPRWLLNFAAGCCMLFMLIGIPGNLFTVIALFRATKLRNATATFIMNLSISDLMFCCFNLPLATSTFWHSSWRHGALLCRLFPLLRYGLLAVSLFTILAITINRYVMIGHPRLYPTLYKQEYLMPMVLATWIIAFGVLIVTWFESWGRFGLDPAIGSCSILPDVNGHSPKEFLFVLAFVTPCIAIVVSYARIFHIVRKTCTKNRRKNRATNDPTELTHDQRSLSPRNQEELSVRGSKQSINSHLSPKKGSEIFLNLVAKDTSSENHSFYEAEPRNKDKQNEEESEERTKKSTKVPCLSVHPKERGLADDPETIKDNVRIIPRIEITTDDIPFVDEYEETGLPNSATFPNNEQNRAKDLIENSSENSQRKLEKMANEAAFIESALWLRQVTSNEAGRLGKADSFLSTRSNSPQPGRGSVNVFRRESKFLSIGKFRSSDASPRMSSKDKKLLKMILVIFSSFLICYLPITITKTLKECIDWRGLNIAGYILIYLTTCINPVIYVVMSSEYRCAYKNVLLCRSDVTATNNNRK